MRKKNLADDLVSPKLMLGLVGRSPLFDAVTNLQQMLDLRTKHSRMFENMDIFANPFVKLDAAFAGRRVATDAALMECIDGHRLGHSAGLANTAELVGALFEHSNPLAKMYSVHKTLFDSSAFASIKGIHERFEGMHADAAEVSGESFEWVSEDEIVLDLGVVPICPACTRRAHEDPAYWSEQLAHFTQPRLELIAGGDEGDGQPAATGVLRLVTRIDDADEE